jgi:hypothetical protein
MQQLKARDFKSVKTTEGRYLTISYSGVISISPQAVKSLKLQAADRIIITKDESDDYHIGKAKSTDDPDAFKLRKYNDSESLSFNAKALVNEIVTAKDLAVHPDKKKSVRLDINFNGGVHWNNVDLFQIITD